jgi:hypothetical protein
MACLRKYQVDSGHAKPIDMFNRRMAPPVA